MKIYNYNGAANLAGLRIRQARMESVSYTHLDVYKRQAQK